MKNLEKVTELMFSVNVKDLKEHIRGKIKVLRSADKNYSGNWWSLGMKQISAQDLSDKRMYFGECRHGFSFVEEDKPFMQVANLIALISKNDLRAFIRKVGENPSKEVILDYIIKKLPDCIMFQMRGFPHNDCMVLSEIKNPNDYAVDKSERIKVYESELKKLEKEIRVLLINQDNIKRKLHNLKVYQEHYNELQKIKK